MSDESTYWVAYFAIGAALAVLALPFRHRLYPEGRLLEYLAAWVFMWLLLLIYFAQQALGKFKMNRLHNPRRKP